MAEISPRGAYIKHRPRPGCKKPIPSSRNLPPYYHMNIQDNRKNLAAEMAWRDEAYSDEIREAGYEGYVLMARFGCILICAGKGDALSK